MRSLLPLGALVSSCLLLAAQDKPALPEPVLLTSREDHKRTMDLLGIKEIRRGADGNNRNSPNAANYDESKANPYPDLPDVLTMKDGTKVTTPEQWTKRRAEIVEDFDREVYGRTPRETPKVTWEVKTNRKRKIAGVDVVHKELLGKVDNSSYPHVTVEMPLTLTTPADAKGPVPVIIEFGFSFGNVLAGGGPPQLGPNSWQGQLLAKGWGYAVLQTYSVQGDNGAALTKGIIGLCNKGQPRKVDDWGALKAWAWGAGRVLDYLETDKAVDAKKVGIEGHSRFGKAALVTLAYDERFSTAYVSSSGAAGAKLHRRNWGEKVENVAGSGEYHWMAGNYIKYAGPLTAKDLPVDSHMLIALCAPRPVFISAGTLEKGDGWVDAKGMFMAAAAAGPVYKLLGKKDLGTTEFPKVDTALVDGSIGYKQHTGGHVTGPTWPTFIEFAARHFAEK
jgi:hypothetical protein